MKFKKKSQTIVATVFHKKALKNIKNFFESLNTQKDKNFDLLVFNDGVSNIEKKFNTKINHKIINCHGSINENRINLINHCKKMNYKYLIFIDSDDYMDKKRVIVSKKYLKNYKIVVNDINLISPTKKIIKKNFFSQRINNKSLLNINDILDKNLIGMSNSSIRIQVLKKMKLKNLKDAPIFDWAFWFMILRKNNAVFTNETQTYYKANTPKKITSLIDNDRTFDKNKKRQKQIIFLNIKKNYAYFRRTKTNIKSPLKNNLFWWENNEMIANGKV
jgi:hypothetical protein